MSALSRSFYHRPPEQIDKPRRSFSMMGATPESITAHIIRAIVKSQYIAVTNVSAPFPFSLDSPHSEALMN